MNKKFLRTAAVVSGIVLTAALPVFSCLAETTSTWETLAGDTGATVSSTLLSIAVAVLGVVVVIFAGIWGWKQISRKLFGKRPASL